MRVVIDGRSRRGRPHVCVVYMRFCICVAAVAVLRDQFPMLDDMLKDGLGLGLTVQLLCSKLIMPGKSDHAHGRAKRYYTNLHAICT